MVSRRAGGDKIQTETLIFVFLVQAIAACCRLLLGVQALPNDPGIDIEWLTYYVLQLSDLNAKSKVSPMKSKKKPPNI